MKILLSVLCLVCLSGCETYEAHRPPLNTQELVDRFIKPAGENAIAGVVFNKEGKVIAITKDGEIVQPCTLPKSGEKPTSTTCHGLTNTDVYGFSQITALRHKGSQCMTFITAVGDSVSSYTYCWD